MQQATRAGFQLRTKVHIAWIGNTLRLEARGERLELPTPEGVAAAILQNGQEAGRRIVDLDGDPAPLVAEWIALVEDRKRRDEEAALAAADLEED